MRRYHYLLELKYFHKLHINFRSRKMKMKTNFYFQEGATNIVSFGAHYDSEEAALLLNLEFTNMTRMLKSRTLLQGLVINSYIKAEYTYLFRNFPRFVATYEFGTKDINIDSSGSSKTTYLMFIMDRSLFANMYLRILT